MDLPHIHIEFKDDLNCKELWDHYMATKRQDQTLFSQLSLVYRPLAVEVAKPYEMAGVSIAADEILPHVVSTIDFEINTYDPSRSESFLDWVLYSVNEARIAPSWYRYEQSKISGERESAWHEDIVKHYLGLSELYASMYAIGTKTITVEEIRTPAFFGLNTAVSKYNYSPDAVPFPTYAKRRIIGAILDDFRDLDFFSKRVKHRQEHYSTMLEAAKVYQLDHPNDTRSRQAIMMDLFKLDLLEFQRIERDARFKDPIGLDEYVDNENFEKRMDEEVSGIGIAETKKVGFIDNVQSRDVKYFITAIRSSCSSREAEIAELYFFGSQTMDNIRRRNNLTFTRVSQIVGSALRKSVAYMLENGNDSSIDYLKRKTGATSVDELVKYLTKGGLAPHLRRFFATAPG